VCNEPIVGTIADPDDEFEGPTLACPKCEVEIEELLADIQRRFDEKRRKNPPSPPRRIRRGATEAEQQRDLRRLKRSFDHLP